MTRQRQPPAGIILFPANSLFGNNTGAPADGLFLTVAQAQDLLEATHTKQVEIDFGTSGVRQKTFTITDADISAASIISVQLAYVQPTGKSLDELEFDSFDFRAGAGAGVFTLLATALQGSVADKFFINYSYKK